jgi:hypothetical protein
MFPSTIPVFSGGSCTLKMFASNSGDRSAHAGKLTQEQILSFSASKFVSFYVNPTVRKRDMKYQS